MNTAESPPPVRRFGRAVDSLRRLKKLWSEHTAGILLSATAAVFMLGWAANAAYIDLLGKVVTTKQALESAQASQKEVTDLRLKLEAMSRQLSEASLVAALEAEKLRRRISETELAAAQLRERLAEAVASGRDQSARLRAAAERTESEYVRRLAEAAQANQALRSDFPSLISRGLWDNGKPSPRAMSNVKSLPPTWSAEISNALDASRFPAAAKAELVELVAQYQDAINRCTPIAAELASAEAAYCLNYQTSFQTHYPLNFQAQYRPNCEARGLNAARRFSSGTSEEWRVYEKEKAAALTAIATAKAKQEQCSGQPTTLLQQMNSVLSKH